MDINLSNALIGSNEFKEQNVIHTGLFSKTILALKRDSQALYAMKTITFSIDAPFDEDRNERFIDICKRLEKVNHPCGMPISYVTLPDKPQGINPAVYTIFAPNKSLQDVIELQTSIGTVEGMDSTQEAIILYGVSKYLSYLHRNNQVHGRLKASNVLLDSNMYPLVSDPFFYELNQDIPNSSFEKPIDYIVSLSKEALLNRPITPQEDIYSFGILALQILTHQINIFSNISNEPAEIEQHILNDVKPVIPDHIEGEIKALIERCLSDDPSKRPSATDLVVILKKELSNDKIYDKDRYEAFNQSLNPKNVITDPQVAEYKRLADEEKDPNMMYAYGRARLLGENCPKDKSEGLRYLSLAKRKGHAGAAELYDISRENTQQIPPDFIPNSPTVDSFQDVQNQNQPQDQEFVHLMNDAYFEKEKIDMNKIVENVKKNYNKPRTVQFEKELIALLKERNFVFTDEAQKRLTTLFNYLEVGIPVLLEGPTGTSKTLSSEIVCDLSGRKLIRFNLSSETKSADLLGRYVGDANSWAGISHLKGPFITAFEEGHTLLLDEINLASPECLQFIEETLDSGIISVELPGMPLREIYMHENFRLIATQNPNKGLFAHKRQDLGTKFLSRFQVINFPAFTQHELIGIAQGLAKGFKCNCQPKLIEDLIEFHMEWSKRVIDDVQCFTVREIAATIRAIADNENIYETIMTIYGARYQEAKREELRKLFTSYQSFKYLKPEQPFYPKEFPSCFQNKSLSRALKSVLFSFKNKRHVILSSAEGVGVTQFARWISQYYDKINVQEQQIKKKNQEFFCVCSEETKCSDLIGRQKPSETMDSSNELIKWKSGFLTKAIKKGRIAVLDSIDEAPATVTERLNGLLDQKYDGKVKYFEVPENPKKRQVEINENFRLLCTCKIDNINQMSPAFINRFDVIVLEDQLKDISPNDLKELVRFLLQTTVFPTKSQSSQGQQDQKAPDLEEQIDDDDFDDGWGEEIEIPTNQETIKETTQEDQPIEETPVEKFVPTEGQINLVYTNIDKKMSMSHIAQFCHAVAKYIKFFEVNQGTFQLKLIVEFAKDMLKKNEDFTFRGKYDNLLTFLLSHLQTADANDDNEFFYEDSPLLCEFIAKLYAASLINIPICVYGPTGAGKTSAARAFARIRPCYSKSKFQMHSFHSGTKPNHFYGTTTIKDRKIHFINGTLTTALSQGDTFIADEMNLSSPSTMKSLAAALEPCVGQTIYIPGVGEEVAISHEFFFIACQNEVGTIGRNAIPASISSRFRYFDYPKQEVADISSICYDISQSFYKKDKGENPTFTREQAKKVGEYMITLNNLQQHVLPKWSLRDVTKLFQRIHFQDINSDRFLNIQIYHNVLFYTMSPVNKEDTDEILPIVTDMIGNTFGLSGPERQALQKCYLDPPKVNKQKQGTYIMKGNCGIMYDEISNTAIEFKLTSLLHGIFLTSLSDESEPILLMGPSGFKTFLSEHFLEGAKVITLNQESTIAQLLGSSAFLTDTEAKVFYLEQICKICKIESKYSEFNEKLQKGDLKKDDLVDCINFAKLPVSFQDAAQSLIKKLFNEDKTKENKSVISNITLEFRPGLFLSAILQGKSLILKNLSNLPTIVLERFNELFSGKHNLTLNEDIHNTFTSETSKELTNFSSSFRVFATCPPNSATKLSEAVLSRFSVICIPSYQPEEQEMVLNSYISFKKLAFDPSLISLITSFSQTMMNHLSKAFTFTQMINIVEMCSHLNRNAESKGNNANHLSNLCIILYRLALGLLEKRKHNQGKLLSIFDELRLPLPEQIKVPMEQNPLIVTRQNGNKGVKSSITDYFVDSANALEKDENPSHISFTGMFTEMLDVLHLGLAANIPVIFEGMPGQGKQTAINYIAKLLGYDIINIVISQATKVEDLLGKVTITRDRQNNIHVDIIKTKLVKAFNSGSDSNSIIVFHNINNASPAVLEVLVSIFDRNIENVLLPNGSPVLKGHLNLVGIFNPQNGMFNRDRLPSSLIFSSLYHIVNDPKSTDVFKVIQELFLATKFKDDARSFFEKYEKTRHIANENNSTPLTLNDIVKYILFREQTFNKFDETTISQMIFAYRYIEQEVTSKVLKEIGLSDMKFIPSFTYNTESQEIFIRVSNEMKTGITLPLKSNDIDTEKIQSAITCLTLPQKHCLLFLACALLSKRSCILQGSTASGKSHIIRLFAKMLGQKLNVYQMNRDTGVSILTGQSVLSNDLTVEDIKAFRTAFADLKNIDDFKEYIDSSFPKNSNEWKPSMFSDLLNAISEYQKRADDISDINLKYLNSAEALIRQTILPANRFHPQESSFVRAMLKGEWVLIDGIESAPPEIAEKISSLCGDNPELDLLECGEGFYFTKKNLPNSKQIHDNFHLFVTYNPSTSMETKLIDPAFVNKCVSFTLPQMDSTPEYTGQIILGSLLQSSYPVDFATNIGARIGNMHDTAKQESIIDRDSFAGDITLTGRTVKFISKEFKHFAKSLNKEENFKFEDSIHKPICYSMEEYYWNSFIDKNKIDGFEKKVLSQFTNEPSYELIQSLHCQGSSPKDRNEQLLSDLRNIQKYATQSISKLNFSFASFVNKCLLVNVTDVPYVYKHIQDTIDIIDKSDLPDKYYCDLYENQYSQLKIMENIFKEIAEGMTTLRGEDANLALNDKDLLKQPDLEKPLSKLLLLKQLVSDNSAYFSEVIPSILFNNEICNLLKIIISMIHDFKLTLFDTFVSKLESNRRLISLIESIFPYNYFVDTPFDMISYWLPLFRSLHESKTTFHVIILDHSYDFTYSKQSEYEPTYIFRENDELLLSSGTQFKFNKSSSGNQIPPYSIPENIDHSKLILRSSLFYGLTRYLLQNPKDITLSALKVQFGKLKTRIPNPRKDQCAKYSLLFHNDEAKPSMIAKAWSIAYTFSYDLIDILFCYMHPLEAETSQAIMHFSQLINKKNIEPLFKFSKWMLNFGNEQSVLWRVKNNTFSVDPKMNANEAKRLIQQIDREIKDLNDAPELNKDIWSKERYITDLENAKIPVKDVVQSLIRSDRELKFRHLMGNLVEKLQKAKITKKQHDYLRQMMVTQISKASEQPLTQEKVNVYESRVNKFLECITKEETNFSQNSIMWPLYTPSKPLGNVPSENMKIYQHILWFSHVNSICLKIIDQDNPNVFESVTELGEFVELQSLVNVLVSRITNSGTTVGSTLLPDDIDIMFSTINAAFIAKFYNDNAISELYHLDNFLNKLENREHIKDERDIEWIHKIASQYPSNFNLVLPKFNPKDLLFLFVGFNGYNETANPGPIIGKLQCSNVIESLKLKVSSEVNTFTACSDMIGKQIYRIIIDPRGQVPNDHKELKNLLKSYQKVGDSGKIVNISLEVMKIAETMEKMSDFKFSFNDIELLKENWIKNTKFVDKYPSLVYWLCKNQRLTAQLQNFYEKDKFTPDKLPFWLFAVRLMSSEDCIKFDIKAETNLAKLISKTVEDSIKDSLRIRLGNNTPIGHKWLNFILSSVSPEIVIPNYRLFYQFLVSLSEDDKQTTQFIESKRFESIRKFVVNACNMLFDDTADKLLSLTFNTANDDLEFIKDPNKYVNSIVKSNISNIYTNFIYSKELTQLNDFSKQKQDNVNSLIDDISKLCDIEEDKKRIKYEKNKAQKRDAEAERMEKDMRKTINEYNNLIEVINSPKPLKFKEIYKVCTKLIKLRKKLPSNIEDMGKQAASFYEFTCSDFQSKTRIEMTSINGMTLQKQLKRDEAVYFKYSKFDENSIQNAVFYRDDKIVSVKNPHFQYYEMHPTSNHFDITQYCYDNLMVDTSNYDVPVLIFGNNMNKIQFIQRVRLMSFAITDYIRDLQTEFKNGTVNEKTFKKSKEFWQELRNFNSTLTIVKFSSDNDSCHSLSQPLRDISAIFQQYQNLIYNVNNYLISKVENSWKMFNNQNHQSFSIFNYEYKLPIPISNTSRRIEDFFRNIKNSDFLSSPILNSDNGQITCCFNTLECQIGPIIPTLYTKNIAMNFISFINEPISISIETEQQYSNWFIPGHYSEQSDIVQIFVNIPAVTSDKIEQYKVPTRIHFTSQSLKELILPCDFSFTLLPLSILIKCQEYPLSYNESDNTFILCTDKMLAKSKLSFSMKYFNLKDQTLFSYQLASLENNKCQKPDVFNNIKDDSIELTIPNVDDVKRLNFALKIAFSDHFKTSIIIDAAVIPFQFEFDAYDRQKKTYSDRVTIHYSLDRLDRPYTLNCRLYSPSLIGGFDGEIIDNKLPSAVVVQSYEGIKKRFNIDHNIKFSVVLKINQVIQNYINGNSTTYTSYGTRYSYVNQPTRPIYTISVKINDIEKKIQLEFVEVKNEMVLSSTDYFNSSYKTLYPIYGYNHNQNDWIQITNYYDKPSQYQSLISPFNYISRDAVIVTYDYNYSKEIPCKVSALNQNKYVCITNVGTYFHDVNFQTSIKYQSKSHRVPIIGIKYGEDFWSVPIIGLYKDSWYPVFKDYPHEPLNWDELDVNDSNIGIAQERINNLPNVTINFRASNFLQFSDLLKFPLVVKAINYWINDFPNYMKADLRNTIDAITNIRDRDSPLMIIFSHNLIRYFCKKFSERYEELKHNNFCIIPVTLKKEDIFRQMDKIYNEFVEVDPHAENIAPNYNRFKRIEDNIKAIQIPPKPSVKQEAFLFIENSKPVPKKRTDTPEIVSHENSNKSSTTSMNNVDIKLPNINIPSQSEASTLTLTSLNNIYLQCLQGTRLLPIFVFNMRKQNLIKMEAEANKYFLQLLNVYNDLPVRDHSFVSTTVNLFISSFATMIGKFKKAGADLQRYLPAKCKITEIAVQDFIQYPEKDKPFLPQEMWNAYSNDVFSNYHQNIPIAISPSSVEIDHSHLDFDDDFMDIDTNDDKVINNSSMNVIDIDNPEQSDIEYLRIMTEYGKKIKNNSDDDDEDEDKLEDGFNKQDDPNVDKPKPPPVVIIKSNAEEQKTKAVNTRKFDGMVSQFTEKDGIERAIRRMQEMSKNGNLKISNAAPHAFKREYLKPDHDKYPILSLMTQSFYLAQEFIKAASDQEIPFSSIAVNILVDCSSFISDENKAFNMLIICGLAHALNALEIPYSAAVIADEHFKCVIKPFNEPHSVSALQRICDCLMIKRYRTKLASSMKFAIDSMGYSIDASRPYRAIFTLTDGLDEQLVLTKAWADSILTNDKISFGFVFIKSSELTGENLQFLEKTWKDFETEVKNNNARSVVKIAPINAIYGKAVADKLSIMFANVMKRLSNPDLNQTNATYEKPKFENVSQLSKIPLDRLTRYLESDLENIKCGVYIENTQALKKANTIHVKPDSSFYRNKLGKITECHLDQFLSKAEYELFLRKFIENRRKLCQAALETIFKPNKASQTILSTTGTDFDITALILNLINPVPDPLIYLEEKGGLVRNYGVTVIIDPSISCLHDLSGPHALQTIRNVLSSISSLDLPCFDLIVAGNKEPLVLCSEVGTNRATNIKSSLWQSLLSVLQTPLPSVDLASAIHAALDLRLMRSTEYSSILMVLTDGLFEEKERERIVDAVNNCVQSGMNAFGIGIGIYPKGIDKLFPQIVYSPNPSNVMKGIASIYGDSLSNQLTEWPSISLPRPDDNQDAISDANDAMRLIIQNASTPSYQSLKQELHDIMPSLDAFDDMYNEEQDIGNKEEGYKNPIGRNTELYVKDLLKTQKILIVMLWDCTMNSKESKFVHPDFIFKSSQPGKSECIKKAVDHYGIELKVVQDYDAAIVELTNQTRQGYCDYYAVWVFCGPPYEVLPNKNADPHLIGDFIEVLIKFWKNGGSIVFMAEGGAKEQLTYQANLFLEKVEFEQEPACPSKKTKLRLIGEHAGTKVLLPDESETLSKNQTFNRSSQFFKQCERTKLSHNIGRIFEGITISYAKYDLETIKPFRPFARDSEGGLSTLFYPANLRTGTGDIIIDCGFTKCFTEMTTDGTFRYIQNIAGWTARPEVHVTMEKGIQPCDWRPKAVLHTTQKGRKWIFKEIPKPPVVPTVDPLSLPRNLWCIDCSGSVGGSSLYHGQLSRILSKYRKGSDEFYLWDHTIKPSSYSGVLSFISNKSGYGGTSSELIADICQRSSIRDHLIIVTDGKVGTGSIDRSDTKMKSNGIKFKYVTTYVIGRGGNLSVGAPYSRGCPNVTIKVLNIGVEMPQASLSAQDMATLNGIGSISSYSQFTSQYKNLESAVQAKTLGTNGDPELKSQLNSLNSRIKGSGISSTQLQDFNKKIQTLQVMADGALRNAFTLDDIGAALQKSVK